MKTITSFKIIFILLTAFVHFTAFAQDTNQMKEKLAGTWLWQQTKVCQRSNPPPDTPDNCKCTKSIVLTVDGILQQYVNDKLDRTTSYTVSQSGDAYIFHSDIVSGKITVDENNLVISTCETDGTALSYIKTY